MADNVLGTVQIVITGDTSQLQASFARAEGMAAASGQVVARGFAQGADGADKIVVAIGRLAGVIQAENAAMSLAFQRNIAQLAGFGNAANAVTRPIREIGDAAGHTVPQMAAVGGAVRTAFGEQSIRAVERFLTLIPGVGAALQAAFPIIGALALVESLGRIFEKSEKVTAAEKEMAEATKAADAAFTSMAQGIDKLNAKAIGRQFGPAAGARAEVNALEGQKADAYRDLQKAKDELGRLATEAQNKIIARPTGGAIIEEEYLPKIQAAGRAIEVEQGKVISKEAELKDARSNASQLAQTESGALAAKRIEGEEKASTAAAEISKQRYDRDIELAQIAGATKNKYIEDAGDKEIAAAALAVDIAKRKEDEIAGYALATRDRTIQEIAAKANAEAYGKPDSEKKLIASGAATDTQAAKDKYTLATEKGHDETLAALARQDEAYAAAQTGWAEQVARVWSEQFDTIAKKRREAFETANAPVAYNQLAVQGAQEVLDKGAGQQKELQIEGQKIALEAVYSQQIIKTGAARVAYLQQIAALDQAANTAKLAGLAADLHDAEVNAALVKGTREYEAALKKVAELKVQIADVGQQGINQQIQAQGQVTGAENANDPLYQVGTDIKNAFQKLPGELGSALANALFDHRKGDSTGKQVGEAFKNAGKQLVGSLLTTALKDLGEKIVAETGIQTLFNGIFQTGTAAQTVATTANTAAVVANTAAQAASAGAGAAGGIASAAGGVAGAAGSTGAAAATGGLSELAPIIGGVISGVISAVATVWGDAKIIQAIDATTAAVNGLRQFLASGSQGYSTSGEAGGPTTSEGTFANAEKSASDAGGALSQIPYVAGILGSFGLGNGMPVRIVGIDPGVISGFVLGNSLVGGLGGILGFDKGGPVPNDMIAQVHGGEWVLTKDQVAGRAPLPTELTGKGLSSAGLPSRLSLPSAQPSGSTPAGSGGHTFNGPMNFYGVQNVRQMMRQIADVAKSASPGFSPYSR